MVQRRRRSLISMLCPLGVLQSVLFTVIIGVLSSRASMPQGGQALRDALYEHWRWNHFWFGKTELDPNYVEGKRLSVLWFFRDKHDEVSFGFCSSGLGLCQEYRHPPNCTGASTMTFIPAMNIHTQLKRFIEAGWSISRSTDDYQTEEGVITLPTLAPPKAIRDRTVPADFHSELPKILKEAGCSHVVDKCRSRLLIPFFSLEDPELFIYRECSTLCGVEGKRLILILTRGPEGWHLGATAFIADPARAQELRRKIEANLLIDISFSGSGDSRVNYEAR